MAIVKILTRHSPSYRSLIQYILDETKLGKDEVFTQNLRSKDIDGYVREFMENEAFRRQARSDQVFIFHEIISFHSQTDNAVISKKMVNDLVHSYIGLRGQTGVILGACHRDVDHVHLHFCVSGLHYRTGKSFGLSRAQLQEVKVKFQEYHKAKYPELTMSEPEHGKRERDLSHAEWHRQQRQQFIEVVRSCFDRATSQRHFLELLRDHGLHHYERNGKPTGIEYEKTKFRFSRLLENSQFESLPIDLSEEQKVLEELREIREQRQSKDREERDFENEWDIER